MVEAPLPLFFFLPQNDIHHEWFCCQQVMFSKDLSEDCPADLASGSVTKPHTAGQNPGCIKLF